MPVPTIIGLALCGLGTLLTCLNVYLSFLRYPLHRWRGGTQEDYRWISGYPLVGSLSLWIGAFLLGVRLSRVDVDRRHHLAI